MPSVQEVSSAQETLQASERIKKYDKPHMIIPDEDMAWILEQRPPVYKLWGECWRCDPYGSRWMPLRTSLGKENLKKAKRPLIDAGLFLFENRLTIVDGQRSYEWWIKNLHGCRSSYWKLKGVDIDAEDTTNEDDGDISPDSTEVGIQKTEVGTDNTAQVKSGIQGGINSPDLGAGSNDVGIISTEAGSISTEIGTDNTTEPYLKSLAARVSKALINFSGTSHKHFTISLTIQEREDFLNFCLEKITAIQNSSFKVHTDDGWIAKHYEQYWNEFCNKYRPEVVETAKNAKWDNHPQRHEWVAAIEKSGNPLVFAGRDKQKQEFVKWANENKLFSWLQEKANE
jgi:hypothetical protein